MHLYGTLCPYCCTFTEFTIIGNNVGGALVHIIGRQIRFLLFYFYAIFFFFLFLSLKVALMLYKMIYSDIRPGVEYTSTRIPLV